MATVNEYQAGTAALMTFVDKMLAAQGKSWEESFIPSGVFSTGAKDVIDAADAVDDQSAGGRLQAGVEALRAALDSTGKGGQVNDADCEAAANAILNAVGQQRKQVQS